MEKTAMLGLGIYPLAEAARYTGVPQMTVRHWFIPRSDRKPAPLFKSRYRARDGDFAVSFLDLIEVLVARFFRSVTPPVKVSHIRRVHEKLQEQLHTAHPFAHVDLCASQGKIVIESASGPMSALDGQAWFAEMRRCLERIEYEPASKIASRWNISRGIVIDPAIHFGKPVIKGTGVTTFVLASQFIANKRNAALVADLYGVDEDDVQNAVRFEERHGNLRVA